MFVKIIFLVALIGITKCQAKISLRTQTNVLNIRGGSDSEISSIDWRYFLAGGICAACSHGITTPIDVVKTKMQTDPEKYTQGVLQAAKDIIKTEGVTFLLAGLGPTVAGYGFEGALKFGFYEAFKIIFKTVTPYQVINFLLASVIAGAVASVVLCPMEEARIKMVGQESWAKENVVSGIARLIREDGIFSSFAGLAAMLAKQIPYTMGKQVSFDIITKIIYKAVIEANWNTADLKWAISIVSAFLASIVACLCSQPGDMILTATYKGSDDPSGKNFFNVVKKIYKSHGLTGFYLGVSARIMHVASIITTQLVLYDIVRMALGLPVTGSH